MIPSELVWACVQSPLVNYSAGSHSPKHTPNVLVNGPSKPLNTPDIGYCTYNHAKAIKHYYNPR